MVFITFSDENFLILDIAYILHLGRTNANNSKKKKRDRVSLLHVNYKFPHDFYGKTNSIFKQQCKFVVYLITRHVL